MKKTPTEVEINSKTSTINTQEQTERAEGSTQTRNNES